MKFTMAFAFATAFLCSGCLAGETVLLRNKTGELARCEVTASDAHFAGFLNKQATLDNCVNAYRAAGFVKIEVPEDSISPRDSNFSDCPQGQILQNGTCHPQIPGR